MEQNNALEILLRAEIPAPQEKSVKIKRLSKAAGEDVVFTLRELTFSRVAEIRKLHNEDEEMELHILLAGVVSPDLRSRELRERYNTATPAELVKKLLSPGEITDLSREVERLSGYRTNTIEDVKKN